MNRQVICLPSVMSDCIEVDSSVIKSLTSEASAKPIASEYESTTVPVLDSRVKRLSTKDEVVDAATV